MANNQLLASDSFSSGSLAAGWAVVSGQTLSIVTGSPFVCEAGGLSATYAQQWNGFASADQISEFTIDLTNEANTLGVLYVRMQSDLHGYQLNISAGSLNLYKIGVGTPLFTKSALTFAAGDIWTLQAAGSCLSIYQNYKFLGFVYDTSYATGVPGFGQYTSVNVTHAKVHSWRGYNCVQQDGIWQKQGICIPAIASDLASSGSGTQNPSIIYEGNAQILSGNVFKMWFVVGNGAGFALAYAESLTGLPGSWSRYASNVIASTDLTVTVFKNGTTYYAYSCFGANVTLYTSSNGLTWSSQGTVFSAAGKQVTYFSPLAVVSGTWYATYIWNSTTFPQSLRLATSPDGAVWTDYPGNPVDTNFWGVIKADFINGAWHAWGQTTNPNAQETTYPGTDPGEGVRKQTVDFITWTNPVHSAHHSQLFEGVNAPDGGCYVSFPINVNGKAYLYYTASSDDTGAGGFPSKYQIGVATGPSPIASIITQPEDAVSQIATDAFTSGAGDLSASWTLPTGGTKLKIIAGPYVEPTATNTVCQAVYTGASFSANQYSEAVVHTLSESYFNSAIGLLVLASTTALTDYEANIGSPTGTRDVAAFIYKRVANSASQLGPGITCTPTVGDKWRLSVVTGSDGFPVLSLFQNGFLILQVQDQSATPITTGNPGIKANATSALADAQIASWAGGNANVIPTYATTVTGLGAGLPAGGNSVVTSLTSDTYTVTEFGLQMNARKKAHTISVAVEGASAVPTTITADLEASFDGGTTWVTYTSGMTLAAAGVATSTVVANVVSGPLYRVNPTSVDLGSAVTASIYATSN